MAIAFIQITLHRKVKSNGSQMRVKAVLADARLRRTASASNYGSRNASDAPRSTCCALIVMSSGLRHDVGLQHRVGRRDVGDVEAELFTNDVAPLRDRRGFVEGDLAIAALTAEAAVAGDDQLLRRNVFERRANRIGDSGGPIGLDRK